MSAYVIIVDFHLKPGCEADFRRLVDENAKASCQFESGCRRFDVLEPLEEGHRVLLYEIYDSRQAFDQHLRTAHFAKFNAASEPHVAAKKVTEYSLAVEGSADR